MAIAILERWRAGLARLAGNFLFRAAAICLTIMFCCASLGLGTLAAYVTLREREGSVVAALILCAIYAIAALLVSCITVFRFKRRHVLPAAATPGVSASSNLDALLESLEFADISKDQKAIVAAVKFARGLSPPQVATLALAAGFLAALKIRK